MFNNSERAGLYADAANEIQGALAAATQQTRLTPSLNEAAYSKAAAALFERVGKASIVVETGRYRLAAAAATSQAQDRAKEDIAEYQRLASEAAVVGLDPTSVPAATGGKVDVLTTGVDFDKYKGKIKVYVDGRPTSFDEANSKDGKIAQAVIPPGTAGQSVPVRVQVGPVSLPGERPIRYQ
jgi:phage gp36-like protein